MCRFYKQGRCNKGDQCKFLHTGKPGAAATSGPGSGSSKSGSKGRGKGRRRRKDSSRRPSSKDSKTSKNSSQGSKGSGSKGNKNKPRVPAAVCLLGALIAASTSTPADAASFAFRKEVLHHAESCYLVNHVALPVVRFNDSPDYVDIPLRGEARQVHSPSRKYERQFSITNPPKADVQDVKDTLTSAKMLKATLDACESRITARCGYKCSTEFSCSKCIPKNINATCAAAVAREGQLWDIEWIADTGSALDLISKGDLGSLRSYTAPHPINIITANGPSSADVQADIKVPSLDVTSAPYFLPHTPSVLTVGYRGMEEGFDFIWRAYQRPFFRDSKGNKTYMNVRDYVPCLNPWKEGAAAPARVLQLLLGGSRSHPFLHPMLRIVRDHQRTKVLRRPPRKTPGSCATR